MNYTDGNVSLTGCQAVVVSTDFNDDNKMILRHFIPVLNGEQRLEGDVFLEIKMELPGQSIDFRKLHVREWLDHYA